MLLARLGVSARRATANEIPASGVTPIIVAPHEFCVLGEGRGWSQQVLARSVPLNTEQWHTGWFTDALRFLRKAGRGLDINPTSASGLNAWGLPVAFLPLVELEGSPYAIEQAPLSPDFAAARAIEPLTYPQNAAERAYDLLFIGASNQRRAQALGNLAPVLSDRTTFLHCPQFNGPAREGDPDAMTTADAVQLARNARLLLNLHQGESRYFEWHRIYLLGIARGCVVLSEPCLANAWVIEGTHYIGCEADAMGEQIEWLLGTDEGAARCAQIAANCAELVARLTDIKAWLS